MRDAPRQDGTRTDQENVEYQANDTGAAVYLYDSILVHFHS